MDNDKEIIKYFMAMLDAMRGDKVAALAATMARFAPFDNKDWMKVLNTILSHVSKVVL